MNTTRVENLWSHPRALKPGDVLANGDEVLDTPSECGNGMVLLLLSGGFSGHRVPVPGRMPVALWSETDALKRQNAAIREVLRIAVEALTIAHEWGEKNYRAYPGPKLQEAIAQAKTIGFE